MPRWLIDDTAGISAARVFVVHTEFPRFFGELMPDDEHDPAGATIAAPFGWTLCRIEWIDRVPATAIDEGLVRSLGQAVSHWDAVRGSQ